MGLADRPGEWKNNPTKYYLDEEAAELRRLTQARLDAGAEFTEAAGAPPTVGSFGKSFLEKRRELGVRSVDDDESRLKTHVYPAIGSMRLEEVQPRHVADVIAKVRAKELAPRTVRNVYSVLRALFRDAQIAGLCSHQPCILTHFQLGRVRDGKKGWRRVQPRGARAAHQRRARAAGPPHPLRPRRDRLAAWATARLRASAGEKMSPESTPPAAWACSPVMSRPTPKQGPNAGCPC